MIVEFLQLLIILSAALLVPIIFGRIRFLKIPEVITEILIGMLIGRSGLNIIRVNHTIDFLSLLGLTFLIFLCGFEFDISLFTSLSKIKNGKLSPLFICPLAFLLTVTASFLLSTVISLRLSPIPPIMLTIIFSSASLGIIVPILKEKLMSNSPLGQVILFLALLYELSAMLSIPLILPIVIGHRGTKFMNFLIIFGLFILLYILLLFTKDFFIKSTISSNSHLGVRSALTVMLLFVVVSEILGLEVIFGAFMAGILLSLLENKRKDNLLEKLEVIGYGFLIPIFFITIGTRFNLTTISNDDTIRILPIFIITGLSVKIIPILFLKENFSCNELIRSGFLLSSNLTIVIALSFICWKNGIITEPMYSTLLAYTIAVSMISPMVFMSLSDKKRL